MMTEGYIRLGLSILILIVLVWILIRFRAKKSPKPDASENLRKRLENGEITKEEFAAVRKKWERD